VPLEPDGALIIFKPEAENRYRIEADR